MKKLALVVIFSTICIGAIAQDVSKSIKTRSNPTAKNLKFWFAGAKPMSIYLVVDLIKGAEVLENEEGEKIPLKENNTITNFPAEYNIPPIKLKPPKGNKLQGNDESETPVWDNRDGKGCTLNMRGKEGMRNGFITVCK